MSTRTLFLALLLVLVALWAPGCGTGGDDATGGARRGAFVFALPFLPTAGAEAVTVGFKNPTTTAAPVHVTRYTPTVGAYPGGTSTFTVPAQGELRLAAAGGAAGGWIHVDTRDIAVLDPVSGEPTPRSTSGYVSCYIERDLFGGGADQDAFGGLAPRADEVRVTVTPDSNGVQLINHTVTPMGGGSVPTAVTFDVDVIGADGSIVSSTTAMTTPNGSVPLSIGALLGQLGVVRVRPTAPAAPGALHRFSVAAREQSLQSHAEGRYLDVSHWPAFVDTGFDVEFGQDAGGSLHDFSLLMSNGTSSTQTVVLQAVLRRGGLPMLASPRAFELAPGRSVRMATTSQESLGLTLTESSFFDDLFGDVFATQDLEVVTLYLQTPQGVDISARHFDAAFGAFHRVLPPIARTKVACVYGLPVASSTLSGTRSYVTITNTTSGPLEVPMRAFTPDLGTEYLLDSVTVPAMGRLDWSPDGILLREQPTDTIGPRVDRLRLEMTPIVGALFNARVESRGPSGAVAYIRPVIVRDN